MNQDKGPRHCKQPNDDKNDRSNHFRSGSEMIAVMALVSQRYDHDEGDGRVVALQLRTNARK